MPPQSDTPPARPALSMLITPSEKWLVTFTMWLAISCNIIARSLLQSRATLANIASLLSMGLLAVSALSIALRVIWRFCPGWTRWLSATALLSCALGICSFFVLPLFSFAGSSTATILSDALAGVCTLLVVLSALFTFTMLEERRTANR